MTSLKNNISPFKFQSHLSAGGFSHSLHKAIITCDGHELNGRTIVKESKVKAFNPATKSTKRVNVGDSGVSFYLDEPKSPMFTKIEHLFNHYKIPNQ